VRHFSVPSLLRRALAVAPVALLAAAASPAVLPAAAGTGASAHVIVTLDGGTSTAERLVARAGGTLGRRLPLVHGFAADVPVTALRSLAALPGVRSITPDAGGHLMSVDPTLGYDAAADEGSMSFVGTVVTARSAWAAGYTGKGVDVALIDSGVSRVKGLASGNVVDGPDLSFESQHADVRYVDTFGHGTHMASIIAGRDTAGTPASYLTSGQFDGVAPDARIVSVKVATADGAADVSQVIAAIGWVTQHAHDYGLNIRVLNLSYGTDSTQSSALDPLSYAVEQAWRRGIVVVVAAGNDGTTRAELADPASNPYVLAVGAADPVNTTVPKDDLVPAFAQRGTTTRHVDVIAPGVHILGLRVPNSYVDQNNPAGRVGTRFIRGSGTSQATAVVSGVAALLLQKHPTASPDQVKYLMTNSASKSAATKDLWQGVGVVQVDKALSVTPGSAPVQSYPAASGRGTIEGARGSAHVALGGVALSGEEDIFGRAWNATTWSAAAAANTAWSGGSFNGSTWTGTTWSTSTAWSAVTWTAADWTGAAWASRSWVTRTWVAGGWDSRTWVSTSWASRTWVDTTWANSSWT
jgi:serine protease AprX